MPEGAGGEQTVGSLKHQHPHNKWGFFLWPQYSLINSANLLTLYTSAQNMPKCLLSAQLL